jgi:predicted Zn-dependent protease
MRATKIPAICVMAMVTALCAAPATAEEKQSPPSFSFPAFPGGVPFVPLGPQPAAVPVESEDWKRVIAQYGPAMTGSQAKIVEEAVAELSRGAGSIAPKGGYRGTLVDTSALNAFAIGDGNVFVTRQLLSYMNDEDELIGVMGHEVGHVIGGHSRFDSVTGAAQDKGGTLLGTFLPALADGAQLGGAVVLRVFDRGQEHSADVAGVKFLADLGRDPAGMGRALTILEGESQLQDKMFGAPRPNAMQYWLRTHPVHSERMGLVRLAASMAPRGKAGTRRSPEIFVRALDGMVFDDGWQQGIVDGRKFRHPDMKFALDAAASFRLLNDSAALIVSGPGDSYGTLKMLDGRGTATERFKAAWEKSFPKDVAAPSSVAGQSGGLGSASGHVDAANKGNPVRLSLWLYAWSESQSFIYATYDPKAAQAAQHEETAKSFRRLPDAEAAAVKVRRLKVVEIAKGDTLATLAGRMAYADFREERFRLINGLFDGVALPATGPVKIVVWSAP